MPASAYPPELAQVCAQVLLLREHGYRCPHGEIYYAKDRKRVVIMIDDALVTMTLAAVMRVRELAQEGLLPPPLVDSPKCHTCSLVGICVPDETRALTAIESPAPESAIEQDPSWDVGDDPWGLAGVERPVRRLFPARDAKLPVYVQSQGAMLRLDGERLIVQSKDEPATPARLSNTSHVALYGNVHVTTPTIRKLMDRGIPLLFLSYGGWFVGHASGHDSKNIELRLAQYAATRDREKCLRLARSFVASKILNCRTLLRRNHENASAVALSELKQLARKARAAASIERLLGIEGTAARRYFSEFTGMLKSGEAQAFDLDGRIRTGHSVSSPLRERSGPIEATSLRRCARRSRRTPGRGLRQTPGENRCYGRRMLTSRTADRASARAGWVFIATLALGLLGSACGSDGAAVTGGGTTEVRNSAPGAASGGSSSAAAGGTEPVATNGMNEPGVGPSVDIGEGVPVVGSSVDQPAADGMDAVGAHRPELDAGSDAAPDAPIALPQPVPPAVYNPCPPSGTDCTIMPLGDSITDGFTVRGGYRIPFFQGAHREGKQFIFVGSQVNGPTLVDNVPFPQRHEGHSAHTIYDAPQAPIPRTGIANYIPRVIPEYHPDIVLLMIGTNDVDGNVDLPNAPNRLGTLIDSIIELDAHSLIVVAQITPTMQDPLNQRIVAYNAGIPAVVKSRADAGKHVLLVNMYDAFARDPEFKAKFLADRLHPNSAGYQVMSDVWNTVVHDLLH